jgi:WASH complex subunit 7
MLEKMNSPLGRIEKNKELKECFENYFKNKLKDVNEYLGTSIDMDEEKKLLELMCTYTLFRKLFNFDELKDYWKQLWTMQKKVPIIEAHSFVFVYVCMFLL